VRGLAILLLAWACSGCTATVIAITEERPRAERVFKQAIHVDLACIAFPLRILGGSAPGSAPRSEGELMVLLYASAAVVAYGVADLPFTASAYALYSAHDYVTRRYEDRKNGW